MADVSFERPQVDLRRPWQLVLGWADLPHDLDSSWDLPAMAPSWLAPALGARMPWFLSPMAVFQHITAYYKGAQGDKGLKTGPVAKSQRLALPHALLAELKLITFAWTPKVSNLRTQRSSAG